MNCQSFEAVVNDIVREHMIDVRVRSEAIEHSNECVHCGQRLADEHALTQSLLSLAAGFESASAPARVEASLLAAFDQQSFAKSHSVANSRSRYWIAAIAAVLLIAVGISAARWLQPGNAPVQTGSELVRNTPPAVAPTNEVPSSLTAGGNDLAPDPPQPAPPSRQKHRPVSTAKAPIVDATNNEIATDFIPVTYGGAANLSEGGRMFRVEMPRSAMATFGLPVNMDRANERVKADVLVGVDGLAHAIRFVR